MSFKIIDRASNSVLHENNTTENDFRTPALDSEWMHIEHEYGKMRMKQWVFDGLRIGYTDWLLQKPITMDWESTMDVVTLYFSLKGGVSIGSPNHESFSLGNHQQNMHYGSTASGVMKLDELRMQSFMIQFHKDAFLRIADGETDALKRFADLVAANKTASFCDSGLPIDAFTLQAIDAVIKCKFSDPLKRIFLLSKAMELLVLQADAQLRMASKKMTVLKSDHDKDCIVFAKDYLLQHIEFPPSIAELAKIAGINEFKLKKGYKEMFGTTIFGHLAETRLNLAKDALPERKKSIAEIAFELGYASPQHFSAAFKKKFGIAPGKAV